MKRSHEMKKIKFTSAGILMIFIGSTMGDSENLLAPLLIIAVGAALVLIGKKRGELNE